MIDIFDLINENKELKQQLKAMGEGYVKLVFELHEAQEKLSQLEVTV